MSNVIIDVDGGMPVSIPPQVGTFNPTAIFPFMGMEVEEYKLDVNGKTKLLWVRSPMKQLVVDGWANVMVHVDFPSREVPDESAARSLVRAEFDNYWKNPKTLQQLANHKSPRRSDG